MDAERIRITTKALSFEFYVGYEETNIICPDCSKMLDTYSASNINDLINLAVDHIIQTHQTIRIN